MIARPPNPPIVTLITSHESFSFGLPMQLVDEHAPIVYFDLDLVKRTKTIRVGAVECVIRLVD